MPDGECPVSHSAVCLTGHKFSEVPKAETVHQTSWQAAHPMGSAAAEWPGLPLQSCRAAFPVGAVGGSPGHAELRSDKRNRPPRRSAFPNRFRCYK